MTEAVNAQKALNLAYPDGKENRSVFVTNANTRGQKTVIVTLTTTTTTTILLLIIG